MASSRLTAAILSLLLLILTHPSVASYAEEKTTVATPRYPAKKEAPEEAVDVVVEGLVYCQSCNYSGTWSLNEAVPIPGAKVSVICRNYRDRVSYYNAFTTNNGGYFYANLKGYAMRHPLLDHPLQSCAAKLVSSPMENCSAFSNINYGINGAALRYEKKRLIRKNYEAVIYSAGPLVFRPDRCPPKQY
ncbi:hypothetical protein Nepgr_028659 [Nepenthes gracilis]|uniref:Non-classical arabinogalactan protein 30 n=1 Tax=Nepenthes gracilis TaxID=150966 RepID=A0AAD3TCY4_NEPGR|nr:hypothetical protein Nepgr_028659 [Nepenthes gracilis]